MENNLVNSIGDFGKGFREGYLETARAIIEYYRGVPGTFPKKRNSAGLKGAFLGGLVFATSTPIVGGLGIWKGLDWWINYNEPPMERTVYLENGKPSYEVVVEEEGARAITNWYSGQKIIGDMPIRRGPKAGE